MSETLLELRGISASYGAIQALSNVSLKVPKGGIVALLGSNGAGKSSTLNAISHLINPGAGEVIFEGQAIQRLASDEIVRRGLVQVPEGREVFKEMSVRENLELGAFLRPNRRDMAEDFEKVYAMFPRLKERSEQRAATLSGGEQQMLAIGRALMLNPRLLLLDEPFEGLAPVIVEELSRVIQRLREEERMTLILVEQHVDDALELCDEAIVLDRGRVRHHGTAKELLQDRKLLESLVSLRAVAAEAA